jgi:hypothetical protein
MTSETQEPVAEETKSAPVKKIEAPKPKPAAGKVFSALGLMLLEIILPALAAGGVLLWLFGGYNLWQIGRPTSLVVFGIVMVVMAIILAAVLDTLTIPIRMSKGMKAVRFARDPRTRIVKLGLGGLIIPIIVLVAVNLAPLPSHGTVMNYLIAAAVPPVKLTPPDEVGAIAIRSENPSTRLLSIQVLQGFRSPEAMNQLVRLVMQDTRALSDPGVSDALSKAIAAYGAAARDTLLISFKSIDPQKSGGSTDVSKDLYDRYFGHSFDSLKTEITNSTLDQAAREAQLAQLQVAQAQLKTSLTSMGYKPTGDTGGDPRLDFILQTFLAMDLKQDADLLTFAKSTAADTRYSSQVRGDALLLVGKLGEQKDLDLLYSYLKSSDDILLTRSLQAIAALQTRLSGTGSK